MVCAPVVNCICSSSSRAAGRSPRSTSPAASSACGSEAKAIPPSITRGVERLDAERVARQRHAALQPLVDRDRIHAAQGAGIGQPVAQPEMQRRLAIALGGEPRVRHVLAQLAVVVDLAIGDQGGRAGEQRLVAAARDR